MVDTGPYEFPCDSFDMNCDRRVDALDTEPFLDLLFHGGVPCNTCTGDGDIDAGNLEGFLNCLFLGAGPAFVSPCRRRVVPGKVERSRSMAAFGRRARFPFGDGTWTAQFHRVRDTFAGPEGAEEASEASRLHASRASPAPSGRRFPTDCVTHAVSYVRGCGA